ncbi:hypothetical protein BN2537_8353 [Streptomyces venezuelae]|nr:hypothetical protein BN2537_8353 [Streptomyces venezuelae]
MLKYGSTAVGGVGRGIPGVHHGAAGISRNETVLPARPPRFVSHRQGSIRHEGMTEAKGEIDE